MAMLVLPPHRRWCQISTHWFQCSARCGEGSTDGGKLLFISFGVSFRLPFPSRGGEREGGDRHHYNQGKENPPEESVFGAFQQTFECQIPLGRSAHSRG